MASRCANSTSMSRKSLRGGGQPPGPGLAAGGEADASYEKQQLSAAAQRLRAVRQSGGWKGMRWADDFPSQSAPGIENQGAGIEAALHGTARSHKIGSDAQPSATPVGASRGSRGSGNPDASSGHAASSPIGDDLPRPGVHTQGGFRSDRDRPSGAERRAGEGRGQGGDGDGRRAPSHPVGGVSDAVLRRQAEQAAEAEENRTAWGPRPRGWLARVDRATLVHPNRSFRVGWDVALLALLCYIALVVPFRIAFLSLSDAPWMEPLSHAITALFMVDVLLNFRTGYVHAESGVVVLDSARIARLYLRSWFAVDLVASVPWEWIFDRANVDSDGVSPQLLKALRLLRLSRLTKLLRLLKIQHFTDVLEERLEINRNYLYFIRLVFVVAILAHFFACGFFFTATVDADALSGSWVEDDPVSGADAGVVDQYVASLYWSFTVMTTVGLGDVHAVTDAEKLYSLFAMFIAAGTFGYVVASMSELLAEINIKQSLFNEKINELNAYMSSRRFPKDLRVRMRRYFRYYLQRKTVFDERAVFEELSPHLRNEVSEHYARTTAASVPFLQERDPYFIGQLIPVLKPILFSTNESVVTRGSVASELYIITSGTLHVFIPYQRPVAAGEAGNGSSKGRRKGSFFGAWSNSKPFQAILSGKSTSARIPGTSADGPGRLVAATTPYAGGGGGAGPQLGEGSKHRRRPFRPRSTQRVTEARGESFSCPPGGSLAAEVSAYGRGGEPVGGTRHALRRLFRRRRPDRGGSARRAQPTSGGAGDLLRCGSLSEGDLEGEENEEEGGRVLHAALDRPGSSGGGQYEPSRIAPPAHATAPAPPTQWAPASARPPPLPHGQRVGEPVLDTGRVRGPPSGVKSRGELSGRSARPRPAASTSGAASSASGPRSSDRGQSGKQSQLKVLETGAPGHAPPGGQGGGYVEATPGIEILRSAPAEMLDPLRPAPPSHSPASHGDALHAEGGGLMAPAGTAWAESRSHGWARRAEMERPRASDGRYFSSSSDATVLPSPGGGSSGRFHSGEHGGERSGDGGARDTNSEEKVEAEVGRFATVEELPSEDSHGSKHRSHSLSATGRVAIGGVSAAVAAAEAGSEVAAAGDPGLVPGTEEWATSADADVQEVQQRVAQERAATEAGEGEGQAEGQDEGEAKRSEPSTAQRTDNSAASSRCEELHIANVGKGDVVGEMALLVPHQRGRRCASLRAASPSEVLGVDYADLHSLLMSFRDVLDDLLDSAYDRNRAMEHARRAIRDMRRSGVRGPAETARDEQEREH